MFRDSIPTSVNWSRRLFGYTVLLKRKMATVELGYVIGKMCSVFLKNRTWTLDYLNPKFVNKIAS